MKTKTSLWWTTTAVILIVSWISPVWGMLKVEVVKVTGKAEFAESSGASWKPLKAKMKLGEQSVIRTHEMAKVILAFGDQAVVVLHELSEVSLKSLYSDDKLLKVNIKVTVGRIWNQLNKSLSKDSSYVVDTPAAIAAVRGTRFFVESDSKTKNTRIGVWKGSVDVSDALKSTTSIKLEKGHVIEVVYNQPPSPPYKMMMKDIEEERMFNEMFDNLGLVNVLAPGMVEMAKYDQERVREAEKMIRAVSSQKRGTKKIEQDFKVLERAIAKLYADTKYLLGKGARITSGKETLICLFKNEDNEGKPIPGWNGPYISAESNFFDPYGREYCLYQKKSPRGNIFLMLHSNGFDKIPRSSDDIQILITEKKLQRIAKESNRK